MMKRLAFLIALICVSWVYADSFRTFNWFEAEAFIGHLKEWVQSFLVYSFVCAYSLVYAFIAIVLIKEIFSRNTPLLFLETHRLHEEKETEA